MQILNNSHQVKQLLEWQTEHKWGKHTALEWTVDSVGQRLGVLGYGSIGRQSQLLYLIFAPPIY
jgi:phosphoglycerate dehydrogenase-like enzyme